LPNIFITKNSPRTQKKISLADINEFNEDLKVVKSNLKPISSRSTNASPDKEFSLPSIEKQKENSSPNSPFRDELSHLKEVYHTLQDYYDRRDKAFIQSQNLYAKEQNFKTTMDDAVDLLTEPI